LNGGRSTGRRPDLTSEHFALNWQRKAMLAGSPVLTLAVAKRLLPRAIDRNSVKRVAREAFRSWGRAGAASIAEPRAETDARVTLVFIRLRKRSSQWNEMPAAARKRLWRSEIDSLLSAVPPAS
jgi:Ribonuclease P